MAAPANRAWSRSDEMSLLVRAMLNGRRHRRDEYSVAAWARAHGREPNACYLKLRKLRADPALRPPDMTGGAGSRAEEPPQAPAARGSVGQQD